ESRQVHVELDMLRDAQRGRDGAGGLHLVRVALTVAHGERVQREPFLACDRSGCVGIQAAAQEDDRPTLPASPGPRCICAAAAGTAPEACRRAPTPTACAGS